MRKIVFASLMTMATVSSGLADVKHGFYAGVGVAGVVGNHDATLTYTNILPPNTRRDSYQFSKTTAGANIMVGYMAAFNNLLVGAEADFLFNNFSRTNSVILNAAILETQKVESTGGAWGLALRLGYSLSDRIQPYIRLGIENRSFKLTSMSIPAVGMPLFATISSSAHKTAFTPGVGVDFKVTKNFALGLEYRYALYSSITKVGFQFIPLAGAGRFTTFKLTPRVSTGLVSVKYIWG